MAKSPRERKADQIKRDRINGIIHRSIKMKVEILDSIKKIAKEKNKTIDEVFGALLSHALENQEDEINGISSLQRMPPNGMPSNRMPLKPINPNQEK